MEAKPNTEGVKLVVLIFVIINVIFAFIYVANLSEIYNDTYNYDGFRFALFVSGLSIPLIILMLISVFYKMKILPLIILGMIIHWTVVGVDVSIIPYYGMTVSITQIVYAFLYLKLID